MEFPDLFVFAEDHPPTPYDEPIHVVKVGHGFLPKGSRLCSVGWIEKPGFPTGNVPDECIDKLVVALDKGIFWDEHYPNY